MFESKKEYIYPKYWNDEDIIYTDLINVANKYKLDLNSSNNKPINSGMISLVFKIPKENSEECMIIKLKRKDIDKKLNDTIEQVIFKIYMAGYYFKTNWIEQSLEMELEIKIENQSIS